MREETKTEGEMRKNQKKKDRQKEHLKTKAGVKKKCGKGKGRK